MSFIINNLTIEALSITIDNFAISSCGLVRGQTRYGPHVESRARCRKESRELEQIGEGGICYWINGVATIVSISIYNDDGGDDESTIKTARQTVSISWQNVSVYFTETIEFGFNFTKMFNMGLFILLRLKTMTSLFF